MAANVTVIAQPDAHNCALHYAEIAHSFGMHVTVNFPNLEGYIRTRKVDELINRHTDVLIFILSREMLAFKGKGSGEVEPELSCLRIAVAPDRDPRQVSTYLIVSDQETEAEIASYPWIANRQWLRDNARTRQRIADLLSAAGNAPNPKPISAFGNVDSILRELEPSSKVTRLAHEREPSENISYEIFTCTHRFRSELTHYVHLHRGVTISSTASHLKSRHPKIFEDRRKMIVMSIEPNQSAIKKRIENVKLALNADHAEYLENLLSNVISLRPESQYVERTFIEPQVREVIDSVPSDFSLIRRWLVSPHPGTVVLYGQGGIGKTWSILNLRDEVQSGSAKFSREMPRQVIYIASTDIKHTLSRRTQPSVNLTLYDLYVAAHLAEFGENSDAFLSRNLFYRALELGNFIVFIDGLDEVIARYRAFLDPAQFFNDIDSNFDTELDTKVVITCRTLFFDENDFQIPANLRVFELLAFDGERRDEFFDEFFSALPNKLQKAKNLSDQAAKLPDGRYVPFVLDLIRDHSLREADGRQIDFAQPFTSHLLHATDPTLPLDLIVGKFCARETEKSQDALTVLKVDHQVEILMLLAKSIEVTGGGVHREELGKILKSILHRRDVEGAIEQFLQHPLISQDIFASKNLIELRFDFMFEFFLSIQQADFFASGRDLDKENLNILSKYCQLNSEFSRSLIKRTHQMDDESFLLRIVALAEAGSNLISSEHMEDANLFDPDSLAARFSNALATLVLTRVAERGGSDRGDLTNAICSAFQRQATLCDLAILDGFVRDGEPIRLDFRGLRVEHCLFRAFDIWNCAFDSETEFVNCRFEGCQGQFSVTSGMSQATFHDSCQFDEVFQRIFAQGDARISSSNEQMFLSIKSLLEDFYRQARFRDVNVKNLERFYGQSNSTVPFKKLFRLMKKHKILGEKDCGHYKDAFIEPEVRADAERLITQSVLTGRVEELASELFHQTD